MQKRMFGENEPSLNKVRVLKQIYDLKQKQKSNNQADDKNSENIKNIENRKATGYDESNESDKYNKNNESERPYKLNELNQREGFQKKRQ
ncbi:MAG: hypothetical protein GWP09_02995 [Nitrospiraceae bacterium]|nr:hypothetical protein [Nitrospiraceae bacterium]